MDCSMYRSWQSAGVGLEQGQWVVGAIRAIDAVVQMRRRAACVAGGAYGSQWRARFDHVACGQAGLPIVEMRVVMAFACWAEYPHLAATESAFAHGSHDAAGRADHRSAPLGEYVHACVATVASTWCAKGIGDAFGAHALHRNGQGVWWWHACDFPSRSRHGHERLSP